MSNYKFWHFAELGAADWAELIELSSPEAAIAMARGKYSDMSGVEIWDGACRIWPPVGSLRIIAQERDTSRALQKLRRSVGVEVVPEPV